MTVTATVAVQSASPDLLLVAGANRLGQRRRGAWPLLRKGSLVAGDKALGYAETHFDVTAPGTAVVDELADYLEISTWGHVFDGWRYLSQSANALMRASRGKALHLAYYAELRAAMCILACSGVAILKEKHYSIGANGDLFWFRGPTHKIAWEALTAWAKEPRNALAVIAALKVDSFLGVPWLELCRTGHSQVDLASHWLMNWSIDLSRAKDDRDARNEASYRPDLFGYAMVPLQRKDIEAVRSASAASLHSEAAGETQVQGVLVADLCKKSADFRFGQSESREEQFWRGGMRWLTTQHGLSLGEAKELVRYIRTTTGSAAGHLLSLTDPSRIDAYSVFARAFFMLHLASAIALEHRDQMNVLAPGGRAGWPDFIVRQFGLQAGLWDAGNVPIERGAIEAELEVTSERIEDLLALPSDRWYPANRHVFHYGVEVNKLYYNAYELQVLRRRHGEDLHVDLKYGEEDVGFIHVFDPDRKVYIQVDAVNQEYAKGLRLEQHNRIRASSHATDAARWPTSLTG